VKPFFKPALVDESKIIHHSWRKVLLLFDPANLYVHIHSVNIFPRRAREVVITKETSSRYKNDNRILIIDSNDEEEKTGNISFHIEAAAFNGNYSVYSSLSHHSRSSSWRWRYEPYGFNLSVIHPSDETQVYQRRNYRTTALK
jgi:hypothetical protein